VLFLDILPFDIDPCLWTLKVALRFINGDASKPGNISSRILPMSIPVWGVVSEQGNPIVGQIFETFGAIRPCSSKHVPGGLGGTNPKNEEPTFPCAAKPGYVAWLGIFVASFLFTTSFIYVQLLEVHK
jgi:hypothetical protein